MPWPDAWRAPVSTTQRFGWLCRCRAASASASWTPRPSSPGSGVAESGDLEQQRRGCDQRDGRHELHGREGRAVESCDAQQAAGQHGDERPQSGCTSRPSRPRPGIAVRDEQHGWLRSRRAAGAGDETTFCAVALAQQPPGREQDAGRVEQRERDRQLRRARAPAAAADTDSALPTIASAPCSAYASAQRWPAARLLDRRLAAAELDETLARPFRDPPLTVGARRPPALVGDRLDLVLRLSRYGGWDSNPQALAGSGF